MTYLGYIQRVTTDGVFDAATILDRLRRTLTWAQPKLASMVTDDAIIRAIEHLNEQQLEDIGVRRKLRKSTWQSSGRGVPPTPVFQFDYFWIKI